MPMIASLLTMAALAYVYAYFLWRFAGTTTPDEGTARANRRIADGIQTYLHKQTRSLGWMVPLFAVGIGLLSGSVHTWIPAIALVVGGAISVLVIFVATRAGVRALRACSQEAHRGIAPAFRAARAGAGFVGFIIPTTSILLVLALWALHPHTYTLLGLALGCALVSVLARTTGGIFAKGIDVGCDAATHQHFNQSTDQTTPTPQFADHVGDVVSDISGMSGAVFELCTSALVVVLVLSQIINLADTMATYAVFLLMASIASGMIGFLFIKLSAKQRVMSAIYRGIALNVCMFLVCAYVGLWLVHPDQAAAYMDIFWVIVIGVVGTILALIAAEYMTATAYAPIQKIAERSQTGHATNVIAGMSLQMRAGGIPLVIFALVLVLSESIAGIPGIMFALMGMLSGIIPAIAIHMFAPIVDSAQGVAHMGPGNDQARETTTSLNMSGNTMKTVSNVYLIGLRILIGFMVFFVLQSELVRLGQDIVFDLADPRVLIGLCLAGITTYMFAGLGLRGVVKTANRIIEESSEEPDEEQWLTNPNDADHTPHIATLARTAIDHAGAGIGLIIATPLVIGLVLRIEAIGGYVMGLLVFGSLAGFMWVVGGGAWDSAKQYIELGNFGGKGSRAHKAAITGDMVGDPFKDTVGPALGSVIICTGLLCVYLLAYFV